VVARINLITRNPLRSTRANKYATIMGKMTSFIVKASLPAV
jgi:hypothetical protein